MCENPLFVSVKCALAKIGLTLVEGLRHKHMVAVVLSVSCIVSWRRTFSGFEYLYRKNTKSESILSVELLYMLLYIANVLLQFHHGN
jgi:hypothetical protein